MKVRVKHSEDSISALLKANVPSFIVEEIVGNTYPSNGYELYVPWKEQITTWSVPSECIEPIEDKDLVLIKF